MYANVKTEGIVVACCVLRIPTHRDAHSEETAAILLDDRHDDHSSCPSTVQKDSATCVRETPTDTKLVRDMDLLTIANCKVKKSEPIFPSFYLYVIAEPSAEDLVSTEFSAETRATMDVFLAERMRVEMGSAREMVQGGKPCEGEQYEKGVASHGNSTFHKFYKRISSCPSQGLRCTENSPHLSVCTTASDTHAVYRHSNML